MAKSKKSNRRYRTGNAVATIVGEAVVDNLKRAADELEREERKARQMAEMWRMHGKFARFIGTRGCK